MPKSLIKRGVISIKKKVKSKSLLALFVSNRESTYASSYLYEGVSRFKKHLVNIGSLRKRVRCVVARGEVLLRYS